MWPTCQFYLVLSHLTSRLQLSSHSRPYRLTGFSSLTSRNGLSSRFGLTLSDHTSGLLVSRPGTQPDLILVSSYLIINRIFLSRVSEHNMIWFSSKLISSSIGFFLLVSRNTNSSHSRLTIPHQPSDLMHLACPNGLFCHFLIVSFIQIEGIGWIVYAFSVTQGPIYSRPNFFPNCPFFVSKR